MLVYGILGLLKQCFGRSTQCRGFVDGAGAAFSWGEIVAEIGAVFFADDVCLGFAAFVVDFGIVVLAVFANVNIGTAMWTLFTASNQSRKRQFFIAAKTNELCIHDVNSYFIKFGLRPKS